jgi:hypothetical protein
VQRRDSDGGVSAFSCEHMPGFARVPLVLRSRPRKDSVRLQLLQRGGDVSDLRQDRFLELRRASDEGVGGGEPAELSRVLLAEFGN